MISINYFKYESSYKLVSNFQLHRKLFTRYQLKGINKLLNYLIYKLFTNALNS